MGCSTLPTPCLDPSNKKWKTDRAAAQTNRELPEGQEELSLHFGEKFLIGDYELRAPRTKTLEKGFRGLCPRQRVGARRPTKAGHYKAEEFSDRAHNMILGKAREAK